MIECEINKVSHSALQRPLNDLYEEDHQGFDGFVLGMKVLFAFSLYSLSFFFFFSSITTSLIYLSACLSTPLLLFYLFPRIHQSAFSICVPIYLSVGLLSAILSSDRSVY